MSLAKLTDLGLTIYIGFYFKIYALMLPFSLSGTTLSRTQTVLIFFLISRCQITGHAENLCFPAVIGFFQASILGIIFSSVIIIRGLAVVFWKVHIILTFPSCFLFLYEKKKGLQLKYIMIPYSKFCLFQYLSPKWGRIGTFFPLWKYLVPHWKRGHRRTMLSKSVSRSSRRIFQMFPDKLL